MTAPGLLGSIVLDILIDESVVIFLEAIPPALADTDRMSCQNLFAAFDTDAQCIIGQTKHSLLFIENHAVEAVKVIDFLERVLERSLVAGLGLQILDHQDGFADTMPQIDKQQSRRQVALTFFVLLLVDLAAGVAFLKKIERICSPIKTPTGVIVLSRTPKQPDDKGDNPAPEENHHDSTKEHMIPAVPIHMRHHAVPHGASSHSDYPVVIPRSLDMYKG